MTILAWLPALCLALMAAVATPASRVTMLVIDLSWTSLAWSVEVAAARSAPLTCRFSVLGKDFLTPAQRASSEVTPSACTTHIVFWPPSLAIRAPALSPARLSSEPKYISAPYLE